MLDGAFEPQVVDTPFICVFSFKSITKDDVLPFFNIAYVESSPSVMLNSPVST